MVWTCNPCSLVLDVALSLCSPTLSYVPTGLRKLEAFFGFLITVMALSFGYEVKVAYRSRIIQYDHCTV